MNAPEPGAFRKEKLKMAQELIYSETKSHWDDDMTWIPGESGKGVDTHTFTLPAGMKFARYSIDVDVASLASYYKVESAPKAGATGKQQIQVRWWYNPFGKIRYTLHVYGGEPETVTVWYGENNWVGKALNTMEQDLNLRMPGRGSVARKLYSRMMRMANKDLERNFITHPKSGSVAATQDTALGLIATVTYGSMGGMVLYALDKGYEVMGRFDAGGVLPFDDELTVSFTKR
jgi:hypothetical protein